MRPATKEERESVDRYIKSIAHKTGIVCTAGDVDYKEDFEIDFFGEHPKEEVCALGYGAERGIRDGMDLFQYCTIKEDERVLTERRLIRNG